MARIDLFDVLFIVGAITAGYGLWQICPSSLWLLIGLPMVGIGILGGGINPGVKNEPR